MDASVAPPEQVSRPLRAQASPPTSSAFTSLGTVHSAEVYLRQVKGRRATAAVVLLGWLGCQWKHLEKYAELYDSNSFHVVAVTSTVTSWSLPWKYAGLAVKVHELLEGFCEPPGPLPVYFHTLSNGGSIVAALVLRRLEFDPRLHVRGVIIDSAPSPMPFWGTRRALLLTMLSSQPPWPMPPRLHRVFAHLSAPGLAFLSVLWHIFPRFVPVLAESMYFRLLAQSHPHAPRLVLFGEKDNLIPPRMVWQFVKNEFPSSARVVARCFPDGGHVRLYHRYPEEYTAAVHTLLADTLPRPDRARL
eukprot:GGOE01044831.1.p1 GENE.GGOE01044831.1~~GGOE01044831.1.p1  ORF type:complete len:312 (-),score=67.19 GGOE01044831.1:316-1224(-)